MKVSKSNKVKTQQKVRRDKSLGREILINCEGRLSESSVIFEVKESFLFVLRNRKLLIYFITNSSEKKNSFLLSITKTKFFLKKMSIPV